MSEQMWSDGRIHQELGVVTDAMLDYAKSLNVGMDVALRVSKAMRDEYEQQLAQLSAPVASGGEWEPVPDSVIVLHDEVERDTGFHARMEVEVNGANLKVTDRGWSEVEAYLPTDLRLCRRTPVPALPQTPEPSWADAPEWAKYWAADADGTWWWHQVEPIMHQTVSACRWDVGCFNGVPQGDWLFGGHIDIPLGTDWRTLKAQRPAAQDGEVTSGE